MLSPYRNNAKAPSRCPSPSYAPTAFEIRMLLYGVAGTATLVFLVLAEPALGFDPLLDGVLYATAFYGLLTPTMLAIIDFVALLGERLERRVPTRW